MAGLRWSKRLQGSFDELRVTDKRLVEALDLIEGYEIAVAPIKEKRAEATRPFNAQIKRISEDHGLADAQAIAAEREAALLVKLADRLVDGAQIRVGGYIIPVRAVQTIESVEHGMGWKVGRPMRVSDDDGD